MNLTIHLMLDNMRLEGRREETQLIYTQIWSYHNKEEIRIATTIFVSTAGHVVIAGIDRCFLRLPSPQFLCP